VSAILLMRNAEAVGETLEIRESHRYLTGEGRQHAAEVVARLREQGLPIEAVLCSPVMRAVQTAELAASVLGFAGPVESLPALAPGGNAHTAAEALVRFSCALAVGHEPGLSAVGSLLCERRAFPPIHRAQVYLVRDGHPIWSLGPGDGAPLACR
jgi:phosphohistidine phosphatase